MAKTNETATTTVAKKATPKKVNDLSQLDAVLNKEVVESVTGTSSNEVVEAPVKPKTVKAAKPAIKKPTVKSSVKAAPKVKLDPKVLEETEEVVALPEAKEVVAETNELETYLIDKANTEADVIENVNSSTGKIVELDKSMSAVNTGAKVHQEIAERIAKHSTYGAKPFVKKDVQTNYPERKNFVPRPNKDHLPDAAANFPPETVAIALIIKNNAEIRRFTSLGIINYLLQKGEIKGNKRYVSFKWNKFSVKYDGLVREYYYTEGFFLNCLVAAFSSFAASAQKTIDVFTRKEVNLGLHDVCDADEVARIGAMTDNHSKDKS